MRFVLPLVLMFMTACASAEVKPDPTPTPTCDAVKVIDTLLVPAQRYEDAFALVPSASAESLTTIAADLQAARRDLVSAPLPSCGEDVRRQMQESMDVGIEGVIFLQSGATDAAADSFNEYRTLNGRLSSALAALQR